MKSFALDFASKNVKYQSLKSPINIPTRSLSGFSREWSLAKTNSWFEISSSIQGASASVGMRKSADESFHRKMLRPFSRDTVPKNWCENRSKTLNNCFSGFTCDPKYDYRFNISWKLFEKRKIKNSSQKPSFEIPRIGHHITLKTSSVILFTSELAIICPKWVNSHAQIWKFGRGNKGDSNSLFPRVTKESSSRTHSSRRSWTQSRMDPGKDCTNT